MADDPFHSVKEEVEISLSAVTDQHAKWLRLLANNSRSAQQPNNLQNPWANNSAPGGGGGGGGGATDEGEVRWAADELKENLAAIDEDLRDLDETVRVVESNPARFRLDAREIAARKEFIARTRKTLRDIRANLNNPAAALNGGGKTSSSSSSAPISRTASLSRTGSGLPSSPMIDPARRTRESSNRDALFGAKTSAAASTRVDAYGRSEADHQASNQKFIDREQGLQQQIMRDQDAQLTDVMDTVGNLKEVAVVMGHELDDQTRLLEDLDSRVETTGDKLKGGMKRLQEFIKANADTKQQWMICGLVTLLIFLLFLVIYL